MDPDPSPFHFGKSGDRGVTVTRGFASPGKRILRAHIDPDLLPRWLGTAAAPVTEARTDPRPGGRLHLAATLPDGRPTGLSGQFIDLTETRIRLEARTNSEQGNGPLQITVEIEAEAHGTLLALSLRYPDRATRDAALHSGLADALDRAYLRLDSLLQD